jgi:integrase
MTKRADGRYHVKVTTPDGPRVVYGRTQAEARRKADEIRERISEGAPVRDATRPLADWLAEWQATYLRASDRAEATKIMYAGYCRRWLVPTLGTVPLAKLAPGDVTRLLLVMQDAGRSDSTIRNAYTTLRKALDDAVTNGLLRANPVHRIRQPRVRRAEARCLGPAEVSGFLTGAEGLRYRDTLKLILGTGLRRGEACALRWDDVDLNPGVSRVKGLLVRQRQALVVVDTKTARSRRTIALSPAVVLLLRTHMAAQNEERLRASNLWQDSGFVFTTAFGRPVEPQNLLRAVRIASGMAGLAGVKVHTLRHTYATTALMAGVPLKVVSVNMGHASIQITADTYSHVSDEAAQEAAIKVSAALGALGF